MPSGSGTALPCPPLTRKDERAGEPAIEQRGYSGSLVRTFCLPTPVAFFATAALPREKMRQEIALALLGFGALAALRRLHCR